MAIIGDITHEINLFTNGFRAGHSVAEAEIARLKDEVAELLEEVKALDTEWETRPFKVGDRVSVIGFDKSVSSGEIVDIGHHFFENGEPVIEVMHDGRGWPYMWAAKDLQRE